MLALRNYARALLFVSIALAFGQQARAINLEKLIMPGPVSKAHASIEGSCSDCHDLANRERQSALCLGCHKDVAQDIRASSGFHGRMRGTGTGECRGCHAEHLGRDADIARLDQAGFNHSLSNFTLQDAHIALTCGSCHKSGTPYRGTATTCIGCHKKDDAHHEGLGPDCAACHDAKSWQRAHFDHNTTAFPLTNKHLETSCAACHPGERYKGVPRDCSGCHAPDDVHKGSQGSGCGDCHTTATWGPGAEKFEHARETGFALLGRHAHIGCADCHRSGDLHAPIPKDCAGCHKAEDRHESRLGPTCGDCHGNDVWRVAAYDHTKFGFSLEGAHAKVDCHACHTAVVKEQQLSKECASCHRADSPHGGSLGQACEKCHTVTRWSDVNFDHDLNAWPLLGLHVAVTCGQCHQSQGFKDTPKDCFGCHAKDDAHKGALTKDCAACHTPNGWKLWDFDHAARTRFPLTAAHAKAACAQCHLKPQNVMKPSMICGNCHAGDDVHAGRFGQQCQECHTTNSFKRPRTGT
jgi:hypothetical protein